MTDALPPKDQRYRLLVKARKACRLCENDLKNSSRIDDGAHDSDRVGPYSQWQGNLDAPVLVVAQDFSDVAGFRKCRGWPGANIQTNLNLCELFACAGIEISAPEFGQSDDRLFFTNAVLCMKNGARGGRQQSIPARCFRNCSSFLEQTIEIVAPKVVVTLGVRALEAVRHAFEVEGGQPLRETVGKALRLTERVTLMPMYHPSPTVVRTQRSMEQMSEDWRRLGAHLAGPA